MPKVFFVARQLEKVHDVSWNIALKLKEKMRQSGIETRDLSHPKTLSVSHITRPLSCKQYRNFLFGARQLEKVHDVSWNIALKLKEKMRQSGIETREHSHPNRESYH